MVREDQTVAWQSTDPFYDFEVVIYRTNDCTPGFRNVPANGINYFYVLQKSALTIEFTGLDDTFCDYALTVYDTTYGTPFTNTAFSFTEATFVQLTSDPNILTTYVYPGFSLYSPDITIDGVYTIFIRLVQNKNILNQD